MRIGGGGTPARILIIKTEGSRALNKTAKFPTSFHFHNQTCPRERGKGVFKMP